MEQHIIDISALVAEESDVTIYSSSALPASELHRPRVEAVVHPVPNTLPPTLPLALVSSEHSLPRGKSLISFSSSYGTMLLTNPV